MGCRPGTPTLYPPAGACALPAGGEGAEEADPNQPFSRGVLKPGGSLVMKLLQASEFRCCAALRCAVLHCVVLLGKLLVCTLWAHVGCVPVHVGSHLAHCLLVACMRSRPQAAGRSRPAATKPGEARLPRRLTVLRPACNTLHYITRFERPRNPEVSWEGYICYAAAPQGAGTQEFAAELRRDFAKVAWHRPKATRSESKEVFLLGLKRK